MNGNEASNSSELNVEVLKNSNCMLQGGFEMKKACFGRFELPIGQGEDRYLLFEKETKREETNVTTKLPLLKNGIVHSLVFPVHYFNRLHYTSTKARDGKFDFILGMNSEGVDLFKEEFPIEAQEAATLHATQGILTPSYLRISCNVEELWMWINKEPSQRMNCTKKIGAFSEIFRAHILRHFEQKGMVRAHWKPLNLPRDPQNIINMLDFGRNRQRIEQSNGAVEEENVEEEGNEEVNKEDNIPPVPKTKRGDVAIGRGGRGNRGGRGGRGSRGGRDGHNGRGGCGGRRAGQGGDQRDVNADASIEENGEEPAVIQIDEDEVRIDEIDDQPCTSISKNRREAVQLAPKNPPAVPTLAHFASVGQLHNVPEPNENDFLQILGQSPQNPILGFFQIRQEAAVRDFHQIVVTASEAVARRRIVEEAARESDDVLEEGQGDEIILDNQNVEETMESSRQEESEDDEENAERTEDEHQIVRDVGDNQNVLVEEVLIDDSVQINSTEKEKNADNEEMTNCQAEPDNGGRVSVLSNDQDNQEVLSPHEGEDLVDREALNDEDDRDTNDSHEPEDHQRCEKSKVHERMNEIDGGEEHIDPRPEEKSPSSSKNPVELKTREPEQSGNKVSQILIGEEACQEDPDNKAIFSVPSNDQDNHKVLSPHEGEELVDREALNDEDDRDKIDSHEHEEYQSCEKSNVHERMNKIDEGEELFKSRTEEKVPSSFKNPVGLKTREPQRNANESPRVLIKDEAMRPGHLARKRASETEYEWKVKLAKSELENSEKIGRNLDQQYEYQKELHEIKMKQERAQLALAEAQLAQINIPK